MTHEEMRDMYELYALGVLEPDERDEIDVHLKKGCTACRSGVERAAALNAALLAMSPDVAPSKNLRKRVLSSVGVEKSGWGWLMGLATASAALLIAVLWFSADATRTRSELADARKELTRSTAELARARAAFQFLNAPETKQVTFGQGAQQPPRGNVFVNPTSGVLLIASNLPSLERGKTYEMWVIPKGGAPKPAGLFQSDQQGNAVHLLPGPIDAAATGAIAVSVEPEAGSQAPSTTPIIVAPVAGL
mgnify:CR=1 FL=1